MTMLTIDRPALVLALVRGFGRAGRLAPFARRKQAPSDRFNFYVRPSSGKPAEASYSYARVRKNWRNALVTLEGNGKKTKQNKAPADLNKYFFFFSSPYSAHIVTTDCNGALHFRSNVQYIP